MTSTTAARITWLLADPTAREAYRALRGVRGPDDLPKPGGHKLTCPMPDCLRCGGPVTVVGRRLRAPMTVLTRQRGTLATDVKVAYVHRGCIPVPGKDAQRIRARALSASQVRA